MQNYVVIISAEIFLVVVSDSWYLQNCTFSENCTFFFKNCTFFQYFDDFLNKDSETTRKLWNAAWTGCPSPRECASFGWREILSSSSYFEQSNRENQDFRKTALFSKTALFFKNCTFFRFRSAPGGRVRLARLSVGGVVAHRNHSCCDWFICVYRIVQLAIYTSWQLMRMHIFTKTALFQECWFAKKLHFSPKSALFRGHHFSNFRKGFLKKESEWFMDIIRCSAMFRNTL